MATITYTFGNTTGMFGTAIKDEIKYEMIETARDWKLVSKGAITIEYKFSKKDFPTKQEWVDSLADEGYRITKGE